MSDDYGPLDKATASRYLALCERLILAQLTDDGNATSTVLDEIDECPEDDRWIIVAQQLAFTAAYHRERDMGLDAAVRALQGEWPDEAITEEVPHRHELALNYTTGSIAGWLDEQGGD